MKAIAGLFVLVVLPVVSAAGTYKCIGANGRAIFSDRLGEGCEPIEVKVVMPTEADIAQAEARKAERDKRAAAEAVEQAERAKRNAEMAKEQEAVRLQEAMLAAQRRAANAAERAERLIRQGQRSSWDRP